MSFQPPSHEAMRRARVSLVKGLLQTFKEKCDHNKIVLDSDGREEVDHYIPQSIYHLDQLLKEEPSNGGGK